MLLYSTVLDTLDVSNELNQMVLRDSTKIDSIDSEIYKMLNLFAAMGHLHYVKSARMHLQQVLELQFKYPKLYQQFIKRGYFTIRRCD